MAYWSKRLLYLIRLNCQKRQSNDNRTQQKPTAWLLWLHVYNNLLHLCHICYVERMAGMHQLRVHPVNWAGTRRAASMPLLWVTYTLTRQGDSRTQSVTSQAACTGRLCLRLSALCSSSTELAADWLTSTTHCHSSSGRTSSSLLLEFYRAPITQIASS